MPCAGVGVGQWGQPSAPRGALLRADTSGVCPHAACHSKGGSAAHAPASRLPLFSGLPPALTLVVSTTLAPEARIFWMRSLVMSFSRSRIFSSSLGSDTST